MLPLSSGLKSKPRRKPAWNTQEEDFLHAGFLLDLHFIPEGGVDMFSEMALDFQRITQRYIAEDGIHTHRCENLKSHLIGAGIAQPVYGRATGWTDRGSIPGRSKGFFCNLLRPDRLSAHPTSYQLGAGDCFPGGTHLLLVWRSRIEKLYLLSPICLHGVVLIN
jgi:hypothetical protein